ncbi:MAG: hypothetical protein U9Q62_08300 [Campylobacterota bacterium]|nr:hypothetical protein [Campylobacterota bacterium]
MNHVYLSEGLIKEALQAHAITNQEAKELIALITKNQPELLQAS